MKIALLSDIHGNAVALDAVLRDIEKIQVDHLMVLGDLAYRGPEPKRVISTIQTLDCTIIGGNADEWVVRGIREGEVPDASLARMREEREWTVRQLVEEDLEFLAALPTTYTFWLDEKTSMLLCHATPANRFPVILPEATEEDLIPLYFNRAKSEQHLIAVYGHIHLPYMRYINGSVLLNTGSVGMPFDRNPMPSYALVEFSEGHFSASIRRVHYSTELAVEALERVNYPHADHIAACYMNGVKPY